MTATTRTVLMAAMTWCALVAAPVASIAQPYPKRTITMIVPFAAGGATDVIARIVSEAMARNLGQPFVIENVPGAGGTTGSLRAKLAPADGYTLLTGHMGTHASSFSLYATPRYDPRSDFDMIGLVASAPILLFTRLTLPANTLREFIDHAKSNPTTVGHSGVGSNAHLTCALLASQAGIKSTEVPYRGNAPLMSDILAGTIDYSCDQIITIASQASAGHVKALAISANRRSPLLPNTPTFVEAGLPAFDADAWTALFAPVGLPREVSDVIQQAYLEAMRDPSVISRLNELGAVVPQTEKLGTNHLRSLVVGEVERWSVVVRNAGISPQ